MSMHQPRFTVRAKLAGIYGGLILATGAALLTVVYLLLKHNVDTKARAVRLSQTKPGASSDAGLAKAAKALGVKSSTLDTVVNESSYNTLHHLVVVSAGTLAAFTVLALLLGWWLAGRLLAPVQRITDTARSMSWRSLDDRIRLAGPNDELKELADTFDTMLARLAAAFDSQRRFIANASHELRTPLSIQRAAIQLGLADPSPQELAEVRRHLLDANRRSERLIDGLLLLAQCDGGLPTRQPVALHRIVTEVLAEHAATAGAAGVRVVPEIQPLWVAGDAVLLRQLVTNLVGNGLRYNRPGGDLAVLTGAGTLLVDNTGPVVPADQVDELFEPFTRRPQPGGDPKDGAGLGLSIVHAIVRAHDGDVTATARPAGGLAVRVRLPSAEADDGRAGGVHPWQATGPGSPPRS